MGSKMKRMKSQLTTARKMVRLKGQFKTQKRKNKLICYNKTYGTIHFKILSNKKDAAIYSSYVAMHAKQMSFNLKYVYLIKSLKRTLMKKRAPK